MIILNKNCEINVGVFGEFMQAASNWEKSKWLQCTGYESDNKKLEFRQLRQASTPSEWASDGVDVQADGVDKCSKNLII